MTYKILAVAVIGTVLLATNANAQRTKKVNTADTTKKTNNAANDYFGGGGNTTTNKPANNTVNNAVGNTGFRDTTKPNAGGLNLPITNVKGNGNILTDSIAQTMRSEDAIDRNLVKARNPLEYQYIREDDAVYLERVWRVLDTREKMNLPFRNPTVEDGNSELFLSILYKAVTDSLEGTPIRAFKDERFSQPYTADEFKAKFSGGMDTVIQYDLNGNPVGRQVRPREFRVDSVYQYQLKEEWIFDKQTSRMYVRILGIAPMMKTYASDGTEITNQLFPLFWVYYPDLRPVLAKREVYNSKNFGARMSWEELFESRRFSSFIIKSTLDNPYNQYIAEMYPNNTLFRLLEGDHVKEKIFDYEQSLWQY